MFAIYREAAPHHYVHVETLPDGDATKAQARAAELALVTPGRYLVESFGEPPVATEVPANSAKPSLTKAKP